MNKIFHIIIVLTLLSSCAKNITEGLSGYFPFNGNLQDYSGNNNHGFSLDVSYTSNNSNEDSSAINLSKTEIKVDSKVIENGPFTISFWLYIDSYKSKNQYIITNGGETRASQGFSFFVSGNKYLKSHGYDKNRILFIVSDEELKMRSGLISEVIEEKKWLYVTGIWDGKSSEGLQLFINGRDIECDKYSSELTFGPKANLKIGSPIITTDYSLYGKLDEVRLYNRILTKREIRQTKRYR